jgi:hypothetical protein
MTIESSDFLCYLLAALEICIAKTILFITENTESTEDKTLDSRLCEQIYYYFLCKLCVSTPAMRARRGGRGSVVKKVSAK